MNSLKILVVDDYELARKLVISAVETADPKAETPDEAANGAEALEKIFAASTAGAPYDLVFLDWTMEGMSGYDVLRQCRARAALDGMAIVMLTAENDGAKVRTAIKEGVTSYIVKPFTPEIIERNLHEVRVWKAKNPHPETKGNQ